MRHDADPDWTLLAAHLSGEATPAEQAAVERWIGSDPERGALIETLRESWSASNRMLALPFTGESIAESVERHIERDRMPATRSRAATHHVQQPRGRWWSAMAIGGIGIAVVALALTLFVRENSSSAEPVKQTFATHAGEQRAITLRDGTRIRLAPGTTLDVPDGFGVKTRTVALMGQAYFDVRSSSDAPFVVQTGSVTTRVLGTAFSVRRYAGERVMQLAVTSGKVVVSGLYRAATVTATQAVDVDDSTIVSRSGAATARTEWTRGRLVFDDQPVSAILASVGRWYGYEFRLSDTTLAKRHVSTVLKASDAEDMMTVLKALLDVTMTFDGKIVTLRPSKEAKRPAERETDKLSPYKELGR